MITLRDVSKDLGGHRVIDSVSLEMPARSTTVLLGPSGCGKSTLLRLCLGLLWPDAGEVRFDGGPVVPGTVRAVRRRSGYVIQDGGLFPHMTARTNAAVMAKELGWAEGKSRGRIAELAELTRLPQSLLDRYPHELSGGQRQRVALMRALMLDPDALFMDEPLGALDPMVRTELQDDLREIFRELGKTVVLVTHDLAEAAHFGDRIVLLRSGRVVQQGTRDELVESPADDFVTRFVSAQRRAAF